VAGPPHAWLEDGRSLFDLFGCDWTLLALDGEPVDTGPFEAAAQQLRVDLRVVRLPHPQLSELYEAPLVLIRPDQIVAWRSAIAHHAYAYAVLDQAIRRSDAVALRKYSNESACPVHHYPSRTGLHGRLHTLMGSLVRHLHEFAREMQLTEDDE
jgi:hypothetical protein